MGFDETSGFVAGEDGLGAPIAGSDGEGLLRSVEEDDADLVSVIAVERF
jgi:hypothetical protein